MNLINKLLFYLFILLGLLLVSCNSCSDDNDVKNNKNSSNNVLNNENNNNSNIINNLQDNINNIANNIQNNSKNNNQKCETEYPLKINDNQYPADIDYEVVRGFGMSEKYIVWHYTEESQPFNIISVMVYNRSTCESFDPFKEMREPPEGYNRLWYDFPRINGSSLLYRKIWGINGQTDSYHDEYWVLNLETNTYKRITQLKHTKTDKKYGDISEGYAAWTEYREGVDRGDQVYIHNLSTGEETCVTCGQNGARSNSTINGDYVSWLDCWDGADYCDIGLYQISTKQKEMLTNTGGAEGRIVTLSPFTKDGKVVWEDGRNTDGEYSVGFAKNYDIYMYDTETKQETQITDSEYQELNPTVSKKYLSYLDGSEDPMNGDFARQTDLIVIDLETNKKLRFERGSGDQNPRCNTYFDSRLDSNFLLVFYPGRGSELGRLCLTTGDLYLYDLTKLDWDSKTIPTPQ